MIEHKPLVFNFADVEVREREFCVATGNYENVVPGWSRDATALYFASNRSGS